MNGLSVEYVRKWGGVLGVGWFGRFGFVERFGWELMGDDGI